MIRHSATAAATLLSFSLCISKAGGTGVRPTKWRQSSPATYPHDPPNEYREHVRNTWGTEHKYTGQGPKQKYNAWRKQKCWIFYLSGVDLNIKVQAVQRLSRIGKTLLEHTIQTTNTWIRRAYQVDMKTPATALTPTTQGWGETKTWNLFRVHRFLFLFSSLATPSLPRN